MRSPTRATTSAGVEGFRWQAKRRKAEGRRQKSSPSLSAFCLLPSAFIRGLRSLTSPPFVPDRPLFVAAAGEREAALLHHANRGHEIRIGVGDHALNALVRERE